MIYTIYKAVNILNNKCYVGFDSKWPHRYKVHNRDNIRLYKPSYFHSALFKYGKENFIWEVVYQSKDREHTLKVMEPYFIKEYDSFNFGYNETSGGEGTFGYKFSDESKLKMSLKKKGLVISNETKRKMSEAHKGRKKAPEVHKKRSETIRLRKFLDYPNIN